MFRAPPTRTLAAWSRGQTAMACSGACDARPNPASARSSGQGPRLSSSSSDVSKYSGVSEIDGTWPRQRPNSRRSLSILGRCGRTDSRTLASSLHIARRDNTDCYFRTAVGVVAGWKRTAPAADQLRSVPPRPRWKCRPAPAMLIRSRGRGGGLQGNSYHPDFCHSERDAAWNDYLPPSQCSWL